MLFLFLIIKIQTQWKGINRKQSTRWQHLSRLKASASFSLPKKFSCYETQQLILGTGTAIWWVTEPHCCNFIFRILFCLPFQCCRLKALIRTMQSTFICLFSGTIYLLGGARYLTAENLKVAWAKFLALSQTILLCCSITSSFMYLQS